MSLPLALTGSAGPTNYTLTCDAGAYAVSGQSAGILKSKLVTAVAGSYAVSGQAANILRSKLVTGVAGSYAVSGHAANVLKSKLVTGLAGAYTVAGQAAGITYTPVSAGYVITAEAGAYVVSGKPATITKSGATETYSGGYDLPTGRRKTKKEVYAERVKLGIIKEDIERKALEVVEKAAEKQTTFEPVYRQDPEIFVRQLMAELRLKVPSPDYTRAIEIALKIAEQDEEDSILLLAY